MDVCIVQNKEDSTNIFSIGLPNTRNEIRKWSVEYLHGIDITSLGPPIVMQSNGSHAGSDLLHKLTNSSMYREFYMKDIKPNVMGLLNKTQSLNYNAMNSFNYFRDKAISNVAHKSQQ